MELWKYLENLETILSTHKAARADFKKTLCKGQLLKLHLVI